MEEKEEKKSKQICQIRQLYRHWQHAQISKYPMHILKIEAKKTPTTKNMDSSACYNNSLC